MLHTGPAIVPHILLNLTHPLPGRRLIDWHLNGAVPISDHHRTETAELGVDLRQKKKESVSHITS